MAGAALALTVLTHLSYALFAILGIAIFSLFAEKCAWHWRIILSGVIFVSALVFSSVWWGTILLRYGFTVLANPARSHGNFEVFHALTVVGARSAPVLFVQKFIGATYNWTPAILTGLIIAGLMYLVLRRNWRLPVLFLLIFLAIGEPDRFLLIIGGIAAAEFLGSVLESVYMQDMNRQQVNFLVYTCAICILLAFPYYGALKMVRSGQPTLSNSVIEMTTWIRSNTAADARYLLLDENNDLDEWIPYLSHRIPIVGSWGGEWVGNLASLEYLGSNVNTCISHQSYGCLQNLIAQNKLQVTILVSPRGNASLIDQIRVSSSWQTTFMNDQFIVFTSK
jgi:hypothetical protein